MKKAALSLLLVASSVSAAKSVDIAAAYFPDTWRQCKQDTDCKLILYGCGNFTASNLEYVKESTERAYEKGGDPRAMNCVHVGHPGPVEARCMEKKCVAFHHPKQERECWVELRHYPNKNDRKTYGMGRNQLFGPSVEECRAKCERTFNEPAPVPGLTREMVCTYDGKALPRSK